MQQEEYLEVDLGQQLTLAKIGLQGDPVGGSGVTNFAIAFSRNGGHWEDYKINRVRKVRSSVKTLMDFFVCDSWETRWPNG